jgi:hypothetical protein
MQDLEDARKERYKDQEKKLDQQQKKQTTPPVK